jgi:anion-transporting  ArsA/GET3 family ATPase
MGSPYYYHVPDWHNEPMNNDLYQEKLLIVSGKGGVGKTVLSCAIARVCAARAPTILLTLDGGSGVHPLLGVTLEYKPQEVQPDLWAANVDSLSAVREYVRRKVPFSAFYDSFLTSRMFRDFAEAAPGFQELMSLGKIFDLVTSSGYRHVVADAPATGHLRTLLDVPAATLSAVQVGPLNHNARKIHDMLLDPERTRVVLATLAEDMCIREALELCEYCDERRIKAGPVLVNQHVPQRFQPDELAALRAMDASAGLEQGVQAAIAEAELAAVQADALTALAGLETRLLPRITTHDGGDLLVRLSAALAGSEAHV